MVLNFCSSISLRKSVFTIFDNLSLTGLPSSSFEENSWEILSSKTSLIPILGSSCHCYLYLYHPDHLSIIPESREPDFADQAWCIPPGIPLHHLCHNASCLRNFQQNCHHLLGESLMGSQPKFCPLHVGTRPKFWPFFVRFVQ